MELAIWVGVASWSGVVDKEPVDDFFTELKEQATLHPFHSEEDDEQIRDMFVSTFKWPQIKKTFC